jgi:hypothetical protein
MSLITSVRQMILPALKGNSAITAIVPSARIYPSKTPSALIYPFIRYGAVSFQPESPSCSHGGIVSGSVHCFVNSGDAEAICGDLASLIEDCLNETADTFGTSVQILPDAAEPDVWHGIVFFDCLALEDRP